MSTDELSRIENGSELGATESGGIGPGYSKNDRARTFDWHGSKENFAYYNKEKEGCNSESAARQLCASFFVFWYTSLIILIFPIAAHC
jgi:hypothetical protein